MQIGRGVGGCPPLKVQTGRIPDTIRLVPLGEDTPPRPDPSLSGNGVRQGAASAFASGELLNSCVQIGGGKVRPALFQKHEFRESTFPQEKIGKPLLAAGPN